MSQVITILYILITFYGLGASLLRFFKESKDLFEQHAMRVAFGIPTYIVIGAALNIIGIALQWWIFLLVAAPLPLYDLYKQVSKKKSKEKQEKSSKFTLKKSTLYTLLVIGIALLCLFMYTKGAFSYTHLENGDPWHHAMSAKYVAQEQKLIVENDWELRYLDGYPPGYAMIMGMTYQVSQDMVWNLKFINALIISLSLIFFFFMTKSLFNNAEISFVATAVLAAVPAYFTHFIWAHTLAVLLFFPLFYAAIHLSKDKWWWVPASITLGALWMTQSTQPAKAMVMLAFLGIGHILHDKKVWKYYVAIALAGVIISLLWYFPIYMKYDNFIEGAMRVKTSSDRWQTKAHFGPLGSATKMYYLSDFFTAKSQNLITAAVGIGFVPMTLAILGLIAALLHKKNLLKKDWNITVVILWFIFTLLGLYGGTKLPLALFSFRFWLLFAIPTAILAALGVKLLSDQGKKIGIPKSLAITILLVLVVWSAGTAKYDLNTQEWGSEQGQYQYGQNAAYTFLKELPKQTPVFNICHRQKFGDHILLAYDKYACPWCNEEKTFRENAYNEEGWSVDPQEITNWMKQQNYEYLFVEGNCIDTLQRNLIADYNQSKDYSRLLAQNSTNNLINSLASSGVLQPVHQTQGSVIFKVP